MTHRSRRAGETADGRETLRWWERTFTSVEDIPKDENGDPRRVPLGHRGTLSIEPVFDEPKRGKSKRGKEKQVPAVHQLPAPKSFPSVPLPFDMPTSVRLAELLDDPTLLDGRKAVALSAQVIEAAMSDGIHPDDMKFSKMVEIHQKLLAIAYKQAATEAVLTKAAVPVFERLGSLMADIINRHVPAAAREMALKELRLRLKESLENAAVAVVKESSSDSTT